MSPFSRWLRRRPVPASLRVQDEQGNDIGIVQVTPAKWRDAEQSMLNLLSGKGSGVVSALSSDGTVLRSHRVALATEDAPAEPVQDSAPAASATTPDGLLRWSDIERLASLLIEAGDRGAARATSGLQAAVEALSDVVGLAVSRIQTLEEERGPATPTSPLENSVMTQLGAELTKKVVNGAAATPPASPGKAS